MGALDDLIARDQENMRGASGGMGELDKLLEMDEARNSPSQDPVTGAEETPSFVGYDPASKPAPKDDGFSGLLEQARSIMSPDPDTIERIRAAIPEDERAPKMIDRLSEAYVGAALPGAGKGASLLKRAAVEGAEAMGMTGLDQADQAMRGQEGAPADLGEAAREIAASGGFGALGGAAGHYIGKGANAVKDWAGEAAAKAKNLVTGMGVRDAKATAAMHGVDAIDENYGGLLEKYSPSGMTGKSPKAHHGVVKREMEASGDHLRNMAKEIDQGLVPDVPAHGSLMPGVPGDLGLARQKLDDELAREGGRMGGALPEDQVQYGNAIGDLRDRVVRKNPPKSFPALVGEKSALQSFGHSGPGQSVPEGGQKQAAAFGGGVLKDEVSRIVGQAKPELRDAYTAQNQNFAELATLEELLRNKTAAEGSGGDLGGILASSALSGIAGAGTGALAADDPMIGALGGGAAGFAAGLGLQGGATRTAIRQGGGARMTDAGGNMLRGLEGLAGKIDGTGDMAGLAAQAADGLTASRPKPAGADVAVGHTRAVELLKTNPAALGGFAPMLQKSADDPQRLAAAISNLARAEPMFRRILEDLDKPQSAQQSRPQSGITFSLEGE